MQNWANFNYNRVATKAQKIPEGSEPWSPCHFNTRVATFIYFLPKLVREIPRGAQDYHLNAKYNPSYLHCKNTVLLPCEDQGELN